MDTVRRKVDFKNYLEDGAIVLEKAGGTRACVCGKKILGKEKHLAIYRPNGKYSASRYNFCRQCSVQLLIKATQRLYAFERTLFGNGGA